MTHHQVAPRYDGKVVHYFSDGSGNITLMKRQLHLEKQWRLVQGAYFKSFRILNRQDIKNIIKPNDASLSQVHLNQEMDINPSIIISQLNMFTILRMGQEEMFTSSKFQNLIKINFATIRTDEGGLSKHQWKRSNYINGLRDYDKIRFALPGDLFSQTQFQRPSTATSQRQLNQNTYEQQQRTTNRLSRPKTAKDPYADLKTKQSLKGLRTIY